MRFKIDQDPAAVERGVGSIHADKGGKTFDVGILEDCAGQQLLAFRHRRVGNGLRRLGDCLNDAGILKRKEPLGNDDVEHAGQDEGAERDHKDEGLAVEHPVEHAGVDFDEPVECFAAVALKRVLSGPGFRPEQLGTGHRYQRQGNHRRDENGYR